MYKTEHYYDPATCSYERVQSSWGGWARYSCAVLGLAVFFAGLAVWVLDVYSISTPEEHSLRAENRGLTRQLDQAKQDLDRLSSQIAVLAKRDQRLYRRFLRVDPIPKGVRQVGVGGRDPYGRFRSGSKSASPLRRRVGQKLNKLERQVRLQKASYRQLAKTTARRGRRLEQVPAIRPAKGPIVSGYGMRNHPVLDRPKKHDGVDFPLRPGTPVVATGSGTVDHATYSANYGRFVYIRHPESGHRTLYAHLSDIHQRINAGEDVARGDTIGYSGETGRTTGPHLHYEVQTLDGKALDPIQFLIPDVTPRAYHALKDRVQGHEARFAETAGGSNTENDGR